jgi:hypothetical protein
MTDKQIIILGCDVSGCKYLNITKSGRAICMENRRISNRADCKHCERCYYKDYIRKEQECEQLKNLFEGVQKSLEVEIDECSKWSQLETESRFELVKTQQQLDQLSKTLTEIKEIAEKNLNIHTCAFKGCGYDLITKQILQKISEVEE